MNVPVKRGVVYPFALEVKPQSRTYSELKATISDFSVQSGRTVASDGYRSLQEWRKFFGGSSGTLTDVWGDEHHVSLEAFDGSDPETLLLVGWREFLSHEMHQLPPPGETYVGEAP